jgi:hypothetical protein
MWDKLPLEALGVTSDHIANGLTSLVHQGVIKGWLPMSVDNGYGYQRMWRITPAHGEAEDHDRPWVEQYLCLAKGLPF